MLDETVVEGIATVLPFHRAIVRDPAFAEEFTVHTRWIETEWAGGIEPFQAASATSGEAPERETVVVEVGGKRLEVSLPKSLFSGTRSAAARPSGRRAGPARRRRPVAGRRR